MTGGPRTRLGSIDALRGADLVVVSAAGFLIALKGLTGVAALDWIAVQMTHPEWHGFHFADFLFPLFLFVAGVSLPFALGKSIQAGNSRAQVYRKAFNRFLLLYGLGLVYSNLPLPFLEPEKIRFVNVLGRIGLAAFVSTIFYLHFSGRARLAWVGAILLGYYAAMFLVPVPGHGAGDLSIEGNLAGWIDRSLLPGRLVQGQYDELGLLTQLPALCLTVMGTVAGDLLRSGEADGRKLALLAAGGAAAIGLGLVWSLHFPINKRLWSSSYVLLTGGLSLVSMALFYALIDVWGRRGWAFFFQVIGINSLLLFLAYRLIDFYHTSGVLFSGLYAPLPRPWRTFLDELGAATLLWMVPLVLYRLRVSWPLSPASKARRTHGSSS